MGETKANTSHRNDEELISTVCHERCWICCYLRYLYIYISKNMFLQVLRAIHVKSRSTKAQFRMKILRH